MIYSLIIFIENKKTEKRIFILISRHSILDEKKSHIWWFWKLVIDDDDDGRIPWNWCHNNNNNKWITRIFFDIHFIHQQNKTKNIPQRKTILHHHTSYKYFVFFLSFSPLPQKNIIFIFSFTITTFFHNIYSFTQSVIHTHIKIHYNHHHHHHISIQ